MRRLALASAVLMLLSACGHGRLGAQRVTSSPTPTPAAEPTPESTPPPTPVPTPSRARVTAPTPSTAAAPSLADAKVKTTQLLTLDSPLAMDHIGDTLYVANKSGTIVQITGTTPHTVLDISAQISKGGEQGLLNLTFSPDDAFLYVYFTGSNGDVHVREYAMRDGAPDTSTAREILSQSHSEFANHNGGSLQFGPDGKLYIGLGDGGSGGDPHGNGQNLGTWLAKLLRIDPRPSGGNPYGVPADNPFVNTAGAKPEIWAYGVRNPWRFSFDRGTGDLWLADVGQDAWEEIDTRPAASGGGENYGWNRLEGSHPYQGSAPANAVGPIYEYPHADGACSVTGGYVYRGTRIPALQGAYVFADFCTGRLEAFVVRGGRAANHRFLGPVVKNLSSFGQDAAGELYVLSLDGSVSRIDPA